MTKTILIVEDERLIAKDLKRTLEGMHYQVSETVATADAALRSAAMCCPDLVLMDIHIKGDLDGIEAARLLRQTFQLPIVYLTAYADPETLERAKRTEPYGYLIKPVSPEELRSTIEIALYKHQMERQLQERERWFSTTLRSVGDAVISTDPGGIVNFMNAAAETLTGWRREEATGKPLQEVLRLLDEEHHSVENPIQRALSQGVVANFNTSSLISRDGASRLISDSAAPIVGDTGDLLGAVLVFRDISEQRRLQRQLELSDRLISLGTMAAGVAHEINNPLAAIVSNLQYHLDTLQNPSKASPNWIQDGIFAIQETLAATERIRKIVDDLRAFSRPQPQTQPQSDVKKTIEWAMQITGSQLRYKAQTQLHCKAAPLAKIDDTRLGQVITNLLINAAQSFATLKPENTIHISVQNNAPNVIIEIKDNGCGIPLDIQPKIFDPFFTTKEVGVGTGLGLSVCHGIVAACGGSIAVESKVGEGSTFRVTLPAAPHPTEPPADATVQGNRRGKILVIDDEAMLRSSLSRILRRDQHQVSCAADVSEALALLQSEESFDLILCDVMLSGGSGVELYEELLKKNPNQAQRMVMMTGGAYLPREQEFLKSARLPCLEKPFNPSQLLSTIQERLAFFTANYS